MSRDQGIDLVLRPELFRQLEKAAMENLENGGRGIGNIVESMLIDPLSRSLFDCVPDPGTVLDALGLEQRDGIWTLQGKLRAPEEGETDALEK